MPSQNIPHFVDLERGSVHLRNAKRIMVIGTSGGGKSTISQRIARTFDLKYFSYDRDVRWLPGWNVRDRAEQRRIVEDMVIKDRWITDGTSLSTFDLRLSRADLAIWMRPPRYLALWGVAKRVARNYGKVRNDMASGCPEILPDREFLHYIWTFERLQTPKIMQSIRHYGPTVPIVQITSYNDADRFIKLAQLSNPSHSK